MERIKHEPIFDIKTVADFYSEKDGVPVKYVCTSAPNTHATYAADIFYRETPHPEFGNRYFGLYNNHMDQIMITNADMIEDLEFAMIEDTVGDLHYSAHRHDYKVIGDKSIDGGRSYVRTNTDDLHFFKVKDGEFYAIQS
jgi:hypothetical protein